MGAGALQETCQLLHAAICLLSPALLTVCDVQGRFAVGMLDCKHSAHVSCTPRCAVLRCVVLCRVDVLLKADQPSDRTYWISVGSQYRKGAPSGYGVVKYSGGSSSGPDPANIVSPAAVVDKKWTTDGAPACLAA